VNLPDRGPGIELVSRERISATREWIVVKAGGRDIRALVLLPDAFSADGRYPLVVALHNFDGAAEGFADLIGAERLRSRGLVVLLPQAGGVVRDWKGPGLTLLAAAMVPDGAQVNDVVVVARVLQIAGPLYGVRFDDVNILGFSQGATLALALSRRLDAERPGAVRRLFLASGSAIAPLDQTLALPGTDVVAYEPGHNFMQALADWRTAEPAERVFLQALLRLKGCEAVSHKTAGSIDRRAYTCEGGASVIHFFEAKGEHAWPGQPAKYDSWLTGRGSISALDFTDLIADAIAPASTSP